MEKAFSDAFLWDQWILVCIYFIVLNFIWFVFIVCQIENSKYIENKL